MGNERCALRAFTRSCEVAKRRGIKTGIIFNEDGRILFDKWLESHHEEVSQLFAAMVAVNLLLLIRWMSLPWFRLALDKEDRAVVIPESMGLKSLIAKGFFDLDDIRKQTPAVERSAAYVRELLKAAERSTHEPTSEEVNTPPAPEQVQQHVTLETNPLLDLNVQNGATFDINTLFGDASPSLIDILTAVGAQDNVQNGNVDADLQSFEDLLQNSFDVWNFFQSPEMSQVWQTR
jgi:hypothetical protein